MSELKNPAEAGVVELTDNEASQVAGGVAFVAIPGPQVVCPGYLRVYEGGSFQLNPYGIPGITF